MAYALLVRSTSGFLLLTAFACSTADGLDTGGGDTGGPSPGGVPEPTPKVDGEACGAEVYGWRTECNFVGEISYENPFVPGEYLELDSFVGTTVACCEGAPSISTADAACVDACVAKLCRVAENIYNGIAQENGWVCTGGCQFDYEGCMAGIPAQQFPHPPDGDDYPHQVTVSCDATNVEPRRPDGAFDFLEYPVDLTYDDPKVCNPPMTAIGLEPLRVLSANTVVEDAGSQALATWWTGTSKGQELSSNIEIGVDYHLYPCDQTECLVLSRFDASIPAGNHAGLEVQSGELALVAVTVQPVVDATGHFDFPAGSLHFVLTASIADVPMAITRTNATTVHGRVNHAADLFELTDLLLRYEEGDLGAELRLDLAGAHVNRAPLAAIRRLDLPSGCDDPVAFETASVDPDGDTMRHYWWTPTGMVDAPSTEIILPPGDHRIVLVSVDARGTHDVASLAFTRHCT